MQTRQSLPFSHTDRLTLGTYIVSDEGAEQNLVGAERNLAALPGSIVLLKMAAHVEYAVTVQNFTSRL